jgi:cytohesin
MESWLTRIAEYLLAQSWQIAVLTVAVAAATFFLRNRSAHARYLLWLVVLAKCLVPSVYTVPLAVLPREESPASATTLPPERLIAEHRVLEGAVTEPANPISGPTEMPPTRHVTDKPATYNIWAWLAVGWLAGALALLAFNLLNALRTQVWLQRQRRTLPAQSRREIRRFLSAHGLKRMPSIWLLDGISQPFVWGLVRGSIYLPLDFADFKDRNRWASLLGHEISHVMRFDATVNSLQVIAQVVFWFHPFVWWANRRIRAEREKCCDEMTIARLHAVPEDYSEAIVETLAARHEQVRPVPSLAVAGPAKNIEERIRTMLRPGKKFYKRPSLVAAVTLVTLAALTAPTKLILATRGGTQGDKHNQSLVRAVQNGDLNRTKSLLSEGVSVNTTNEDGIPTLHIAAAHGHIEIVKLLIARGAEVNGRDTHLNTPLHWAAQQGHAKVCENLIAKGADVNARNKNYFTPLHYAARRSHGDVVRILIADQADVNAKDRWDTTPIEWAHWWATDSSFGQLKAAGALGRPGQSLGWTELHSAAKDGRVEMVRQLIDEGAKLEARNSRGETPLIIAAENGRKDVVELLLATGANIHARRKWGSQPLHVAIRKGHTKIAELLIAKGADINSKGDHDRTPLHNAYWGKPRNKRIIDLLLAKGANLNARDREGSAPLHYAASSANRESFELLLVRDVDINAKNDFGQTPLYIAAFNGKKDIVDILVARGADRSDVFIAAGMGDLDGLRRSLADAVSPNVRDMKGTPLLHAAVGGGNPELVAFLINKGADVNAKDPDAMTALHYACRNGQEAVVQLLLDKGAAVNVARKGWPLPGATPLHDAVQTGHKHIAAMLIAKGADINAKDNMQQTALLLAERKGHKEVVELLLKHGAKE